MKRGEICILAKSTLHMGDGQLHGPFESFEDAAVELAEIVRCWGHDFVEAKIMRYYGSHTIE